jgi:WD40 repeat protein
MWDAANGKESAVLKGHSDHVWSAAFSPDGRRIVTASFDGSTRVWNVENGEEIAVLKGHEGSVLSAAFSPDEHRIVTASGDKTARIWNVRWLMEHQGQALIDAVCREKLIGSARVLTPEDVLAAPILQGSAGQNVCSERSLFIR